MERLNDLDSTSWVASVSERRANYAEALSNPLLAGFLLVVAALISITNLSGLPARSTRWDFSHYYLSALVLREGGNPYRTSFAELGRDLNLEITDAKRTIDRATYPPTFLLCFEPLTLLSSTTAYWVWMSLSISALIASLYLLTKEAKIPARLVPAMVALGLMYAPLWDHFRFAQSQILVLLLIIVMMRSLRTGRDVVAGAALALAILLRAFPVILIGYLVARRAWRAVAWTAISGAAAGAVTLMVVGVRTSFDFLHAAEFVASPYWLNTKTNVSLFAITSRLFTLAFGTHPGVAVEVAGMIARLVIAVALVGFTFVLTRKGQACPSEQDWQTLSLWVVTTILVAPTAWMHYLVLLYIPYAMMLGETTRSRTRPKGF